MLTSHLEPLTKIDSSIDTLKSRLISMVFSLVEQITDTTLYNIHNYIISVPHLLKSALSKMCQTF